MDREFNLRLDQDRRDLAALLPEIDNVRFNLSAESFVEALTAAARCIPAELPLELRYGAIVIHQQVLGLQSIVELGAALQKLAPCPGFAEISRTFVNPTQFLDTCFELRVADFFISRRAVKSLSFGVAYRVRGRIRKPEFTLSLETGPVVVECKRIHFPLGKLMQKFASDLKLLEKAMTDLAWSADFRLEVEFLRPEREQFRTLAERIVRTGIAIAADGGGDTEVGSVQVHVRRRDAEFAIALNRPGLHQNLVVVGTTPVRVVDPLHTRLHAFHSRYFQALRRLVTAAIAAARTQLPQDVRSVVCVGDVPMKFSEEVFDSHIQTLPDPKSQLITLWDGPRFRTYFNNECSKDFVQELVQDATKPQGAA